MANDTFAVSKKECDCISRNLRYTVVHFDQKLKTTSIYDMNKKKLGKLNEHYKQLLTNITLATPTKF